MPNNRLEIKPRHSIQPKAPIRVFRRILRAEPHHKPRYNQPQGRRILGILFGIKGLEIGQMLMIHSLYKCRYEHNATDQCQFDSGVLA